MKCVIQNMLISTWEKMKRNKSQVLLCIHIFRGIYRMKIVWLRNQNSGADKSNFLGESFKWWYKHQIWHKCSPRDTNQICTIGQLKIHDGGHFSRWPPKYSSLHFNDILVTYSCVLNNSKKLFFYGIFAFGALLPTYAFPPSYMDHIPQIMKMNIGNF